MSRGRVRTVKAKGLCLARKSLASEDMLVQACAVGLFHSLYGAILSVRCTRPKVN